MDIGVDIDSGGVPLGHVQWSGYVHLSEAQIQERISLIDQGKTAGREGPDEIRALNTLLARGLACSLVFLLHSVPEYVAGDLLVQNDGRSLEWPLAESRFIAMMDEHYDYKAERQDRRCPHYERRVMMQATVGYHK
jgi:hypothetical protein